MKNTAVELGEVSDLIRGITYKPTDICDANAASAVACMRTKNVQETLDESDIVWIPDSLIRNPAKYLKPGDILVSSANSWNLVGKGCWVPELKYPASAGGFISILRGNPNTVDLRYLYHWFVSPQTQAKLRSYSNKTTNISNLDHGRTLATEIPLPPLEEQRRIAAILDKTAELSGANKRRQDLLRAFPLSVYRQMFGDPRHNPFLWPVFQLGEICLNEDARRVPVKSSDRKAMQGRFPYYGASGVIDHVDDYLFEGQRLLVGEDGANLIARSSPIAFIADGKYWVNNHAHVLSENGKAKLRFLEYYFALVDLKPFVTGSTQPKLTRSALDSLPVPLPPLGLQERFESVLTALDARFAQAEISAQQASSLSCALRYASFQGDAG